MTTLKALAAAVSIVALGVLGISSAQAYPDESTHPVDSSHDGGKRPMETTAFTPDSMACGGGMTEAANTDNWSPGCTW